MSSRVSPVSLSPAAVLRTRPAAGQAIQLASSSGCKTFDNTHAPQTQQEEPDASINGCKTFDNTHAPQTQQGEPDASINGAESEVLAYMTRQVVVEEEDSKLIYWKESVCFDVCPT